MTKKRKGTIVPLLLLPFLLLKHRYPVLLMSSLGADNKCHHTYNCNYKLCVHMK